MFLRPHHFQAAFRSAASRQHRDMERVRPWSYGVGQLDINLGLLAQFEVEITSCEILFPSGVLLQFPEDAIIERRSFREAFAEGSRRSLDVWIGIPKLNERDPNIVDPDDATTSGSRRYVIRDRAVYDENTGANAQTVPMRQMNALLLFEGESHANFETVQIARILLSSGEKTLPTLDPDFVPPILTLESWMPLFAKVRDFKYAVQQSGAELAAQVSRRELALGSEAVGGLEVAIKLQTLNRAHYLLDQILARPLFHPQDVFMELCRIIGDLSIFAPGNRVEDIPPYDHDEVGVVYNSVIETLNGLLEAAFPRVYKRRRFEVRGELLECPIDDDWFETTVRFFLGVRSTERSRDEILEIVDTDRVKFASPSMVAEVDYLALRGIDVTIVDRLPPGLPDYSDVHYFELLRSLDKDEFWDSVKRERVLSVARAVREQDIEYWLYVLFQSSQQRASGT